MPSPASPKVTSTWSPWAGALSLLRVRLLVVAVSLDHVLLSAAHVCRSDNGFEGSHKVKQERFAGERLNDLSRLADFGGSSQFLSSSPSKLVGFGDPLSGTVFNQWSTPEITITLPNDRPLFVNAPVAVSPEAVELEDAQNGTSPAKILFVAGLTDVDHPTPSVYTYRLSSVAGETWSLPRPLNLPGLPKNCQRHFSPSACVSPSKREVVLFGGPGNCSQVFVWRNFQAQQVNVSGLEQTIKHFGHGSVLVQTTEDISAGRVRLLTFGGTSYDEKTMEMVRHGTNDIWQLLFSSSALQEGAWSKVEIAGEDVPPPRILPGWFADEGSAILYGGVAFNADEVSHPLCDLWRLDLSSNSWKHLATPLHLDCFARRECESVLYPSDSNPYPPLATFIGQAKLLVVLVSACVPPDYTIWTLNVSLPDGGWQMSQPASIPMHNIAPIVLTGTASTLISDGQSVYLTVAQSGTYSGMEGRTTYHMLSLDEHRKNSSVAFVDVMSTSGHSFVGSLGCHSPPAVFANLPGGKRCFLLLGGNCPIYSFTRAQTEGMPLMVWSACKINNTGNMQWTKNALAGGPGHGNRIGHSVVALSANGSSISVVFGGISFSQLPFELFFVANELWCFDSVRFAWNRAVTSGPVPPARAFHTATLTSDSRIIMYGGVGKMHGSFVVLGDVWQFTFSNITHCEGEWTDLSSQVKQSPLPAVYGHTATLSENCMLVFGGKHTLDEEEASNLLFIVELENWSWEEVSTSPPLDSRVFHSAVQIGSTMFAFGGCRSGHRLTCTNDSSIFSTTKGVLIFVMMSNNFSASSLEFQFELSGQSEAMAARLFRHQSTLIDETLYIFGGQVTTTLDIPLWNSVPNEIATTVVSCPKGYFSAKSLTVAGQTCQPCPVGTYSTEAGSQKCISCFGDGTTAQEGSASPDDCRLCKADSCHGHGSCTLDRKTMRSTCSCDVGYWSRDRCLVPVFYLLGAAVALVLLLFLCVLIGICQKYRRKVSAEHEKARQLRSSRKEISQLTSVWQIDGSEVSLRHRIDSKSRGGFCEVWLAEYRDMLVAVKRLHRINLLDPDSVHEFEREVEIMRTLRHPNVILFLGAGTDPQTGNTFLIVEYLNRGTLRDILHDAQVNIDHAQRLRFALDAAKGMRFLHGLDPPRIHRDLKSSNLLVSERWVVKVADFGAARLVSCLRDSQPIAPVSVHYQPSRSSSGNTAEESTPLLNCNAYMSRRVGTLLWQSPEMLSNNSYGASTDVYSFGIVLWEIFCRQEPYHTCPDFHFLPVVARNVIGGKRPDIPFDCPMAYQQLMEECWTAEPSARPTFAEIVYRLENQLDVCIMNLG